MNESLRSNLAAITRRVGRRIRRHRTRVGQSRAIRDALPMLLLFPIGYAAFELVRWVSGAGASPLDPWLLVLGTLVVPVVWIALVTFSTWRHSVDQRDSLATADRALGLQDRLQTADEFLRHPAPSAFMQAAIADATAHAERARDAEVDLRTASQTLGNRPMFALLAAILCVTAVWLGGKVRLPLNPAVVDTAGVPAPLALTTEEPPPDGAEPPLPTEPQDPTEQRRVPASEVGGRSADDSSDAVVESRGSTGLGRAAEASAARGSSSSKAAPSNQGQAAQVPPKETEPEQKKDAQPTPPPAEQQRPRETSEEAGTTAGRGASKGSNRNPATSDWASRDHLQAQDDRLVENDDDIEDEDEEQESRGGIQPNLRDRKPPVNRDLRIGFGNQKNPDANGRGGPSEQKKSRGVAALVLGVPIPDRIKGQPNPGRTKITQEQIEPKPEEADPLAAEPRSPRNDPIGHLTRRHLPRWMRDIVKSFFLAKRSANQNPNQRP